jgi:hypothetical protein
MKDSGAQAVIVLESFAYKLAEFIGLTGLKAMITWQGNFCARRDDGSLTSLQITAETE